MLSEKQRWKSSPPTTTFCFSASNRATADLEDRLDLIAMLNERHSGDLFEAEEQRREARRNEEENKGKKKIKWYSNRETENYVQSTKRAQ